MISAIRNIYNSRFTQEKYQAFLKDMNALHPGAIEFRLAETPVFVPGHFRDKMLATCESIIDLIVDPDFKINTERAIPAHLKVQGEQEHPHFMVFDFGICENEAGDTEPQLIEMQGFPSLFAFQVRHAEMMRKHFDIPEHFTPYLNGFGEQEYVELFKEIVEGLHNPDQVVLLELFPHQQKTRIDFYLTKDITGISIVCLTELIQEGRKLYYILNGQKTEIRRIYNRIIFEELLQQTEEVQNKGRLLFSDLDVEWVTHPCWFYRISKFTLPFLHHPHIPETFFLNEVTQLPPDIGNFVLKPLFSFSGHGVCLDITTKEVENIQDPENWILQRKVKYAEIIDTPDGPAKAEIRIFYFWKNGVARPIAINNLARISKGKMIGVDYNKNKTWVGGSLCFFEPDEM
ncbi:MAG: hypothetical protein H7Y03_13925 [Chitinophagaceae bacterium]|nr:hypothetical protein [Chitinophagaceae bacterium]